MTRSINGPVARCRASRHSPAGLAMAVLIGSVAATQTHAQCDPAEVDKLTASDGIVGDAFGSSVSIRGDLAVVGAIFETNENGIEAGSMYVFERFGGEWTEIDKLIASDGAQNDSFGRARIYDDFIVVGVALHDLPAEDDAGAVYIFEKVDGEWTETDKLTASDGVEGDRFGAASFDGDTAIIGAPRDNNANGADAGAIYLFERIDGVWTETDKILASDGKAGEWFGIGTILQGDTAFVTSAGPNQKVYVLELIDGRWTETDYLTLADGNLISSIDISGDLALMGSRFNDDLGTDAGAVYVFERIDGVWTETDKFHASDGEADDWFGGEVALRGETALVGAIAGDDDDAAASGAAYLFKRIDGVWTEVDKITPSDAAEADNFTSSLSLDDDAALIGSQADDDNGSESGSAYVFDLNCTCPADVNGDGNLNVLDFVAFQLLWQDQDPAADCDANGEFNVLDFVCFQQLFQAGCQ